MIYLFLTSAGVYLTLAITCASTQRRDVCLKGLRMFVGAMALIASIDLLTAWDGPSTSEQAFVQASLSDKTLSSLAVKKIPISNNKPNHPVPLFPQNATPDTPSPAVQVKAAGKRLGEYRREAFIENYRIQGEAHAIQDYPVKETANDLSSRKGRSDRAFRSAMIGILLHQLGK